MTPLVAATGGTFTGKPGRHRPTRPTTRTAPARWATILAEPVREAPPVPARPYPAVRYQPLENHGEPDDLQSVWRFRTLRR